MKQIIIQHRTKGNRLKLSLWMSIVAFWRQLHRDETNKGKAMCTNATNGKEFPHKHVDQPIEGMKNAKESKNMIDLYAPPGPPKPHGVTPAAAARTKADKNVEKATGAAAASLTIVLMRASDGLVAASLSDPRLRPWKCLIFDPPK